jgi:hypothetical protein
MSKLITMVELSELKRNSQTTFDSATIDGPDGKKVKGGDAILKLFQERLDKGGRYLAGLRDLDPKPQEKIDAALKRIENIKGERRAWQKTYDLDRTTYAKLYELASLTTTLGLTRCEPGEAAGLHNALQIRLEDGGVELLLDLSYDGVPF